MNRRYCHFLLFHTLLQTQKSSRSKGADAFSRSTPITYWSPRSANHGLTISDMDSSITILCPLAKLKPEYRTLPSSRVWLSARGGDPSIKLSLKSCREASELPSSEVEPSALMPSLITETSSEPLSFVATWPIISSRLGALTAPSAEFPVRLSLDSISEVIFSKVSAGWLIPGLDLPPPRKLQPPLWSAALLIFAV